MDKRPWNKRPWIVMDPNTGMGGSNTGSSGNGAGGNTNPVGNSGDPNPFIDSLPVDLRGLSSINKFRTAGDLATSYLNLERMLGSRVEIPQPNWTPDQRGQFFDRIGRPQTPDAYTGAVKFEGWEPDPESLKAARSKFHELGLTKDQGAAVLDLYANVMNGVYTKAQGLEEADRQKAEAQVKAKYGDKFEVASRQVKTLIGNFADKDFVNYLETTGMGNNPAMFDFLVKLSRHISSEEVIPNADIALQTRFAASSEDAKAKIQSLRGDQKFQKALQDRMDPGHTAALKQWQSLHYEAFPGKSS